MTLDLHKLSTEPALIVGWLTARSIGRNLPAPKPDRGGFRVDTNGEKELRRWLFPRLHPGLSALGREISAPRHMLKLCGADDTLRQALPSRWAIQPTEWVMTTGLTPETSVGAPDGYQIHVDRTGPTTHVRILAPNGGMAASGYATEAVGVFAYDRIETDLEHRRRGLGRVVMITLAAARRAPEAQQILVATDAGRRLYESLGWSVVSPFATAAIPLGD